MSREGFADLSVTVTGALEYLAAAKWINVGAIRQSLADEHAIAPADVPALDLYRAALDAAGLTTDQLADEILTPAVMQQMRAGAALYRFGGVELHFRDGAVVGALPVVVKFPRLSRI